MEQTESNIIVSSKQYLRWGIVATILGVFAIFFVIKSLIYGNSFSMLYIGLLIPLILGFIYLYIYKSRNSNSLSYISLILCRLSFFSGILTLVLLPLAFNTTGAYEYVAMLAIILEIIALFFAILSLFQHKN